MSSRHRIQPEPLILQFGGAGQYICGHSGNFGRLSESSLLSFSLLLSTALIYLRQPAKQHRCGRATRRHGKLAENPFYLILVKCVEQEGKWVFERLSNVRGEFIRATRFLFSNNNGKKKSFCFPAGRDRWGWDSWASQLEVVVTKKCNKNQPIRANSPIRSRLEAESQGREVRHAETSHITINETETSLVRNKEVEEVNNRTEEVESPQDATISKPFVEVSNGDNDVPMSEQTTPLLINALNANRLQDNRKSQTKIVEKVWKSEKQKKSQFLGETHRPSASKVWRKREMGLGLLGAKPSICSSNKSLLGSGVRQFLNSSPYGSLFSLRSSPIIIHNQFSGLEGQSHNFSMELSEEGSEFEVEEEPILITPLNRLDPAVVNDESYIFNHGGSDRGVKGGHCDINQEVNSREISIIESEEDRLAKNQLIFDVQSVMLLFGIPQGENEKEIDEIVSRQLGESKQRKLVRKEKKEHVSRELDEAVLDEGMEGARLLLMDTKEGVIGDTTMEEDCSEPSISIPINSTATKVQRESNNLAVLNQIEEW
ncbi:hypothetical protein MKW98_022369 [Papaver atlanticum]|uniref:Uncharacterized protein n=1 Tax=Papaver atlanticum TaxID=357466 RepID=A0AAD4SPF5_9MAGN|nr:hypothetical protein MKW98_022369 [Papaver atlanticum]